MMLREIGAPFELRLVDRDASAHKSPEYLKLNPNGLIPVLIDRDLVVYETAAIALHLSDRHPEAGLAPAVGTDDRAHFYKWMLHLANTLQPTFLTYFYPERYIGDPAAVPLVKARAEERLDGMFDIVASELAGRHWLLGERFSAVDLFLMLLTRWGRGLKRPPRTIPALGGLAERVLARPAVQGAIEAEGLRPPLI
jgi:glutathione S-transferase